VSRLPSLLTVTADSQLARKMASVLLKAEPESLFRDLAPMFIRRPLLCREIFEDTVFSQICASVFKKIVGAPCELSIFNETPNVILKNGTALSPSCYVLLALASIRGDSALMEWASSHLDEEIIAMCLMDLRNNAPAFGDMVALELQRHPQLSRLVPPPVDEEIMTDSRKLPSVPGIYAQCAIAHTVTPIPLMLSSDSGGGLPLPVSWSQVRFQQLEASFASSVTNKTSDLAHTLVSSVHALLVLFLLKY
jgi:hypothetical protein